MQVAALALELDLDGVGALVARIAGVQRLLDVAGEMHHELQRLGPSRLRLAAVGEDRGLAVQCLDHTVAVGTVAGFLVVALVFAEVDVVPAAGALAHVRVAFAQLVGPVGDAGQGRLGFALQQLQHLRASLRSELRLGQIGDQAMAERPPGEGGGRRDGQCRGERGGNEERGFHARILAGADDVAMAASSRRCATAKPCPCGARRAARRIRNTAGRRGRR